MAGNRFEASLRHESRVSILDLHGEINALAEEALHTAYTEAEQHNADVILLNFSAVDYINSTGIALIVDLLARARKAKRRLLAYGLSDHYREIFQITRLVDLCMSFPMKGVRWQMDMHLSLDIRAYLSSADKSANDRLMSKA